MYMTLNVIEYVQVCFVLLCSGMISISIIPILQKIIKHLFIKKKVLYI